MNTRKYRVFCCRLRLPRFEFRTLHCRPKGCFKTFDQWHFWRSNKILLKSSVVCVLEKSYRT